MKVLFLHQHFKTPYQGGAIRSYYLAKALTDLGMRCIMITAHNRRGYKTEHVDGIEVHYLPVPYENRFGFYRRSLAFLRFAWHASALASRFKDADLCYAISVPLTVGIAARMIKRRLGIPYIFEVGDLWPDAPVSMGFIRNRALKRILYDLEKRIYNDAESIVGLSPAIVNALEAKAPGKPIHLIPNMADTGFFSRVSKQPQLEEKFNVRQKFVVSYLGAAGVANGLHHLAAIAKASEDAGLDIHFILCGEGAALEDLMKQVMRLALGNFSILPFRDRRGVNDILNVTDAAFISYRPVGILETGSPNKYFDGLASGKLIIVNFGGWVRSEIEERKCGIYVDPHQPADFVKKIKPFLTDAELLNTFQKNARALAEEKYSRRILGDAFVNLINGSHAT